MKRRSIFPVGVWGSKNRAVEMSLADYEPEPESQIPHTGTFHRQI